jgi:N-acetyl-gamma-glutamyl-phosphate reductase
MIRTAIYGATGYTGLELVRRLHHHPDATIAFATSQSHAGQTLDQVFPAAPPLPLIRAEDAALDGVDVVFLALPHAAAAQSALIALEAGVRVIDLSADFRLRDPDLYARTYQHTHPAPHLLAEAVYGLTEQCRADLPAARLVANPGCYPTTVLLALWPLLRHEAGLLRHENGPIIIDAKSGVSGAGRAPKQHLHFVELAENFYPYNIGRSHRHVPEMEQQLRLMHPHAPEIIFSPHLLPVSRGMISTIYPPLSADEATIRQLYADQYADEPFVTVLPAGQLASLAHVVHTNRCVISLTWAGDRPIIVSAIDNLVKGASGQAIQNMNVMFGLPETTALS